MEFLTVDSVETARAKLYSHAKDWLAQTQTLPIEAALGKISAEDIAAMEDLPSFRRSTMDGYAVLSADTAAANEGIPVFLAVKTEIKMGQAVCFEIEHGECAEIATGGMMPKGADAVVMAEYCEVFGGDKAAVYSSVPSGENVVQIGEDAKKGEIVVRRGKRLLPQDIGALAAVGVTSVPVFVCPRVSIISTGDELVSADKKPVMAQVRDINSHSLSALAQKEGYLVTETHILPDDETKLAQAIRLAMETDDIVIVSGGSSQGAKDMTKAVIDRVCSPGVFVHGLALKPGKPTILAYDDSSKTLVAGLPGHPVSAMIVFELMFARLLREITGSGENFAIPAQVSVNVASSPGKLTCWPVKLRRRGEGYWAEPIFKKSGLITALTEADGYFIVERDTEGLKPGQTVLVHLF